MIRRKKQREEDKYSPLVPGERTLGFVPLWPLLFSGYPVSQPNLGDRV
jgi:hypothetical protein